MEIPLCEALDEPDLTIGTILVNEHCMVLSTYVHTCRLSTVRNGTRKRQVPIRPQTLADISAKVRAHQEICATNTKPTYTNKSLDTKSPPNYCSILLMWMPDPSPEMAEIGIPLFKEGKLIHFSVRKIIHGKIVGCTATRRRRTMTPMTMASMATPCPPLPCPPVPPPRPPPPPCPALRRRPRGS